LQEAVNILTLWIAIAVGPALIVLMAVGVIFWNRALRRVIRRQTSQLQHELEERKKTEQERLTAFQPLLMMHRSLLESEQRYRMVFENSPVSIWEEDFSAVKTLLDDLKNQGVTDIEAWFDRHPETVQQCAALAKIIDVNRAALALHGAATKQELLAGLVHTFTPESFDTFRRELVCLWNGETEMTADAVVKTLAGDPRHVTIYFSVCPGHEETLSKVVVSLIDITDRRQTEEVLKNTATRLNEAQRLAHIGNWELDLTDNVLIWSDEIFRIFEIDSDKFGASYEAFLDAVHPEDRDAVNSAYTTSLETRTPYAIEHRLLFPDGRVKYVHEQCETYYEGDTPVRSIGTVQDITERIRAEEKITVSEERLRLTLEATQIGIFDWDLENDSWYASPQYYTMLGYEPKEGMGDRQEWLERVHPDDRTFVEAKIREMLAGNLSADSPPAYAYEARMRHADGTYRWHQVKGFNVKRDQQGRVMRMLGIRRDITQRKTAEEALRRLNSELDRRVLDRTAQLEAVNKELEAFAYSVSHDLRAPLRHIVGFVELLRKSAGTVLNEQSRHYMDTISDAVQKMGQLIDDLLSFSRMGRRAMAFQQVNLRTMAREVIREFEPDTAGRTIAWHIGDLPAVEGDISMLRMVLANLVANAVKFTQTREKARIEIGSLPGRNSEAVCFVRDNGVGFDMAYMDKLFGVFQRLHRQEDFEGTGIGLATVHRIIDRHGGRT
jgi:PAS domain S-box-containing protein